MEQRKLNVGVLGCGPIAQAVAANVRPHSPLVTVLTTVIVTLVPSQMSVAPGGSKDHAVPHSMVLGATQVIVGAVVSTMVTV